MLSAKHRDILQHVEAVNKTNLTSLNC